MVDPNEFREYLLKAFPQFLCKVLVLFFQFGELLDEFTVIEHLAHGIGYDFVVSCIIGDTLTTSVLQTCLYP